MVSPQQEALTTSPDALIYLIEVDLAPIGINLAEYFCVYEQSLKGEGAYLNGRHYRPLPIKMLRFGTSSKGTLPRPELAIGDENRAISTLLKIYKPRHATVRRRSIYRKHLDDGLDPNPNAEFEPEEYVLDYWVRDLVCTLHLVTDLEYLNTQVPARKMIDAREGN